MSDKRTINGMTFRLDEEFRQRNRKHTAAERNNLGILIEMEGCKADALTVAQIGTELLLADGYTTLAVCEDRGIKATSPRLIPFPDRQSVLEWIDRVQEGRRNLSQEELAERAAKRRERVQAARAEGKSTREIAEQEGVDPKTIRKDIGKNEKSGGDPSPADEKVEKHGKNGKLFCDRCQRVGPVKDCPNCAEIQAKTGKRIIGKDKKSHPAKKPKVGAIKYDWRGFETHFGHVARMPDAIAAAYDGEKSSDDFKECMRLLREFTAAWKGWQKRLNKIKD